MQTKNFKLFIGYLGNGATVCNSAVYENGDYKRIAHISPAGNIKLYVPAEYIPADAMKEIEKTAERHKIETAARLDRELSTEYGRGRVLNEICNYTPWKVSDALFSEMKTADGREKENAIIKKYYMIHF